ncbi:MULTISPECIES: TIR domain-containing protein [Methylomonas]|uniref:TIR domain-containing protein n=1 Tax=Methylomonas koyamae TaxID=702114 RepID=A0A177NDL6_9GAMM|nr:TIR domain-containing protein [Methylomonas koyamae]OAI16147.1 hypothetical protein A1355_10060 [Methylomonas koyamae]
MATDTPPKRFRIAFSFAGEKRPFVEQTAQLLAEIFGKEKILYDKYHEAEFARFNLGIYLPKLYGEQSELIVPVLCQNYDQKRWTGWEWLHIYSLLTKADGHRVMPSRFDYADADGLSDAAGFIELDPKTPDQFATLILQRLALNEGLSKDYYLKIRSEAKQNIGKELIGHIDSELSDTDGNNVLTMEPLNALEFEFSNPVPLSRLYRQLENLVREVASLPALHSHPILQVLLKSNPSGGVTEIYQYCCDADPNLLLWEISNAIKRANIPLAESGVDRVFDLVAHICLLAGARWIAQKQIGRVHWINGMPSIAMTEELTATIVAAAWFDLGIKLRVDQDGGIKVANLICDHAETQFGVKTFEQTIGDEIYARLQRELTVGSLVGIDSPHDDDLKAGLKMYEDATGASLMVGLPGAVPLKGVDSNLFKRVKQRWGIEMFLYGGNDHSNVDELVDEWLRIQSSLTNHFKNILIPFVTVPTTGESMVMRNKVFISYAHKDDKFREYLVEHLKVAENQGLLDIWDDRGIGAGQDWYAEIDRQLQSCKVAVILISPAFLGSKFITSVEVPTLLNRHQSQGMRIVPLLVRACTWQLVPWLSAMQMRPSEAQPLADVQFDRDQQLADVALEITNLCQ